MINEVSKKKIAVYEGNVMAFKYQSTCCEEIEVEDYSVEWENEQIFNDAQQNRFKVVNGVVVKKTEEELKNQPRYTEYLAEQRKERYKNETDGQKEKVIEILAKESKDPIVMEWIKGKAKIREEVK